MSKNSANDNISDERKVQESVTTNVTPDPRELDKPAVDNEPEKEVVTTENYQAVTDVSVSVFNSDGHMITRNLIAGQDIEIANTPKNKETLEALISRNHIKKLN